MPRVGKAMGHRGDLSLDQRRARRRRIQLDQFLDQVLKAVERKDIARELGRQLLVLNNALGDPMLQWVLKKAVPGSPAYALKIDGSDLAVGCRRTRIVDVWCFSHLLTSKALLQAIKPGFEQ